MSAVVEEKLTEAEARVKGIEGEMIKLRERNKHLQQSLNQKDASINVRNLALQLIMSVKLCYAGEVFRE